MRETDGEEKVLVVANLSRFVQYVELDLAAFKGMVPVEMMGRTSLPPIGELPYLLTLGPYAFYWLALEPKPSPQAIPPVADQRLRGLEISGTWLDVFRTHAREDLEGILLAYLRGQHWFAGQGGRATSAHIVETLPIANGGSTGSIALVRVDYLEEEARTYVLPIAFAAGPQAEHVQGGVPGAVICRLKVNSMPPEQESQTGILYDPVSEKGFAAALLDAFAPSPHSRRRW